jgi:hypothetical protein
VPFVLTSAVSALVYLAAAVSGWSTVGRVAGCLAFAALSGYALTTRRWPLAGGSLILAVAAALADDGWWVVAGCGVLAVAVPRRLLRQTLVVLATAALPALAFLAIAAWLDARPAKPVVGFLREWLGYGAPVLALVVLAGGLLALAWLVARRLVRRFGPPRWSAVALALGVAALAFPVWEAAEPAAEPLADVLGEHSIAAVMVAEASAPDGDFLTPGLRYGALTDRSATVGRLSPEAAFSLVIGAVLVAVGSRRTIPGVTPPDAPPGRA